MSSPVSQRRPLWKPRSIRPRLESLEDRCLLSASMVNEGFTPYGLTDVNGTLFFLGDDGTHGDQLWKSDGTAGGTVAVTSLSPSTVNALLNERIVVGNRLFFTLFGVTRGTQLWETDGTAADTMPIKDLSVPGGDYTSGLTNLNGTLFFTTHDLQGGQLWKTDGTAAGTVLVKTLVESRLTAAGGLLYFLAPDGVHGSALWRSDGTPSGTIPLLDLDASPLDFGDPLAFKAVGNTLYFHSLNVFQGGQLWKSDGTAQGTTLVEQVPGAGDLENFTNVNGTLYFTTGQAGMAQLWKTDGTPAGTVMLQDFFASDGGTVLANLTAVGSTLFFTDTSAGPEAGLWKSDGTAAGTVLIQRFNSTQPNDDPAYLTAVGNTLWFSADDGVHGRELWLSNGTAAGTVMAQDIQPGPGGSDPQVLTAVGNTLFFTADDGVHGRQLWKEDTSTLLSASAGGPYTLTEGGYLTLHATASGSAGGSLTYAWDINGDGRFTDAAGPSPGLRWAQLRALGLDGGASYSVRVRVTDARGNVVTSAAVPLAVQDAPLRVGAFAVRATEGRAFTGPVASFSDPGGADPAGHYRATINWGDGTVTTGTVGPSGNYLRVYGSHTYAHAGSYSVRVTVADGAGPATASATAQVADAPLYITRTAYHLTAGVVFVGAVATFRDANPFATAGEFRVLIAWGDGSTSAGWVTADGKGGFVVNGGHVYATAGNYSAVVQVRDIGGSTVAAHTLMVVSAPPHLVRAPLPLATARRRSPQQSDGDGLAPAAAA